jgi:peptidoglycan/xylan/chitin deacetylase (PgdA/CDA1 family)
MNAALYRNKLFTDVKAFIRLFASIGLYYSGAVKLISYIKKKRNNKDRITILAYHDISDKDYLNLHVPSEVFLSHVECLIEQGYNIISLKEAVNVLKKESNEPIPEKAVVITFDDVYSSFYKTVFPIVKQFEIPVTIFLCTEPVENRIPPFVDALIYAFDNTSKESIDLTDMGLESYSLKSKLLKENALYKINDYSKEMNVVDRGNLLAYIFDLMGVRFPSQELSKEVLSWDEIIEMSRNGLVEFGAHTMNHPSLSRVSLDEVRCEIWASRLCIQLKLGKDVQPFAYPYGSVNDISENVRRITKEEGLSCGCTLSPGVNRKGDDLYLLKRICVTNQIKPQYLRIFSKAVFALHMLRF